MSIQKTGSYTHKTLADAVGNHSIMNRQYGTAVEIVKISGIAAVALILVGSISLMIAASSMHASDLKIFTGTFSGVMGTTLLLILAAMGIFHYKKLQMENKVLTPSQAEQMLKQERESLEKEQKVLMGNKSRGEEVIVQLTERWQEITAMRQKVRELESKISAKKED